MSATFMRSPKFRNAQWVSFVGGEGIVRSYTPEYGTWTYLIEMALGLEPDFGRVGAETMILLPEADLLTTYSEFQAGKVNNRSLKPQHEGCFTSVSAVGRS
ncbi:hypothetical protein ANSO36C_35160 [Nostoc cf. commune SO-36]|uniref:Uncharacterized protein n=1 Tax=Nostoc cf. commune SO-36 TaxID=449208 RepID=A0ABM7Z3X0_NOSCO|nr:hypothetical protein [Nostoc commune]BDI17714.1 hypothetical protein ANSO36C_35160 [Nostoc cf. commune SO-36]